MIRLLAGIMLCCALSAYSQAPAGKESILVTPDKAVDMAIKNNLSLESARLTLDVKKRKSDLVWNQFLPDLSASGALTRYNWANSSAGVAPVPVPLNSIPGFPPGLPDIYGVTPYSITLPQWSVNGLFSASLTISFALVEGIKSIKLDYQAGLISFDKARLQLERDVRKNYNQILLLESNLALLRESYTNAERQATVAEANYKAGLAPRLVWLQAQVTVENMKPTINELENAINALKGSFALSLGLPYDANLILESFPMGNFTIPPDLEELISKAVSGKPDIMELQRSITYLNSARKAQALQFYTPYLRFGWTLSSMFSPALDPFKESWFNGDNWNKGGSFSITMGMSINSLFSFTKEGQSLKDTENTLLNLRIILAQAIQGTELEIFTKLNSLEKIRTTKDAQQATVDLAELSYNLTDEAYRAGLQDLQTVQNAALALDQAKLQLLTQQFSYLSDLIDLEYSIGVPFGTLSNTGSAK